MNMNSLRNISFQFKRLSECHVHAWFWRRLLSSNSSSPDSAAIVIPKCIPRGPTDILKALARTTARDKTASHYRYHDDPFLQPSSSFSKRSYALSKEAGRKAARFIRDTHGECFQHRDAEPFIEAFAPKINFNEESIVNEDILKDLIDKSFINDSITVYELMIDKNIDISAETLQSLLELLCFYNEQEPLDEDYLEERSYEGSAHASKTRWKNAGLADKIFESLPSPERNSYEAMIRGLAQYLSSERAWNLCKEMISKQMTPSVETFNHILKIIPLLRDDHLARWILLQEILNMMMTCKVRVNTETLNACLQVLSRQSASRDSTNRALQLLAEFKKLDVEPSLSGFYFLLKIFYSDKRGGQKVSSTILYDIMDHLSNREFSAVDMNDTQFFVTAMDICRSHLQDKDLAYNVNNLLNYGSNYKFIGNDLRASAYYRNFLIFLCNAEPFDVFMDVYSQLVPNIYSPEASVMVELLRAAEMSCATEYVPHLWADISQLEMNFRTEVLENFLAFMSVKIPEINTTLSENYKNILKMLWANLEDREQRMTRSEPVWSGQLMGMFLSLCAEMEMQPYVVAGFTKCMDTPQLVVGYPSPQSLRQLLNSCVRDRQKKLALKLVEYCDEIGYPEAAEFAQLCSSQLSLTEEQKQRLQHHLGASSSPSTSSG